MELRNKVIHALNEIRPFLAADGGDITLVEILDEKIVKALREKINIASEVLGEELRDWI